MSDHETSTLTIRLHDLADELAPSADPVGQMRAARARYHRQRRNRLAATGGIAAAALLALGLPAAIGSFSADPGRGEVAGPGQSPPERSPGAPPDGEDARKADRWKDALVERAEREERLSAVVDGLCTALDDRPASCTLISP